MQLVECVMLEETQYKRFSHITYYSFTHYSRRYRQLLTNIHPQQSRAIVTAPVLKIPQIALHRHHTLRVEPTAACTPANRKNTDIRETHTRHTRLWHTHINTQALPHTYLTWWQLRLCRGEKCAGEGCLYIASRELLIKVILHPPLWQRSRWMF